MNGDNQGGDAIRVESQNEPLQHLDNEDPTDSNDINNSKDHDQSSVERNSQVPQFPEIGKQQQQQYDENISHHSLAANLRRDSIDVQSAQTATVDILKQSNNNKTEDSAEGQPAKKLDLDIKKAEIAELLKEKLTEQYKENIAQKTSLPPLDFYKPKVTRDTHECISYGLNMYFKKPHAFSDDPDQGGGDLAPNQTFSSQPWGVMGCPPKLQKNLTDYVVQNIKDVVFCRYGLDYLKSFPRCDDLAIGSYKINLDYLIFQKQKQNADADNKRSLIEMSFLKTKGQHQMNKAQAAFKANSNGEDGDQNGMMPIVPIANRMIIPYYKQLDPEEKHTTLEFDSVFESGNLAIALKVSNKEYNCLLQNDINTNGHTQWFYFKVKGVFKKKTSIKFNLINLYKGKSLYQYGMKVLTLDVSQKDQKEPGSGDPLSPGAAGKGSAMSPSHSKKGAQNNNGKEQQQAKSNDPPSWKRNCVNASYIQNTFTNEICPGGLFQVQFTYEFQKGQQEVYFAHSVPYTYSMLNEYLQKQKVKKQTLCHSLAGNRVEYIHVTGPNPNPVNKEQEESVSPTKIKKNNGQPIAPDPKAQTKDGKPIPIIPKKQVIMLTSRVHPGETGASWMMHGLMDTLLNPSTDEEKILVKNLKDHFEFYIIPMLNVDGVINGNYRCSLAACDLNRKWIKPSKAMHPPVFYTKKLCKTLQETEGKQFFLYLDFHGHSVKKNIFQYGNNMEGMCAGKRPSMNVHPSLFPMILSKQFDYFNFQDCTFSMPKSKDATARIQMFHQIRIPFVFTIECSFAGASKGKLSGKHFSCRDLMNVGKSLLKAFWETKKLFLNKNLLKQISAEAQSQVRHKEGDEDSEGCSSSEEADPPPSAKKKNGDEEKKADEIQEEATTVSQANQENLKSQKNLIGTGKAPTTTPNANESNISPDTKQVKQNGKPTGQVDISGSDGRTGGGITTATTSGGNPPNNGGQSPTKHMQSQSNFHNRPQQMISLKRLGTISRDFGDPKVNKTDLGQSVLVNKSSMNQISQISTDFVKRAVPQTQQKLSILGTTTDLDQFNYLNGFKMDPQALSQYQKIYLKQIQTYGSTPSSQVPGVTPANPLFPDENHFYLLQQSQARRNGALPNTLKAHQLNKIYKNKQMFQSNYNQMFGDQQAAVDQQNQNYKEPVENNGNGFHPNQDSSNTQNGFKSVTSKKNNKINDNKNKKNKAQMSKDLIQLPDSIPESVLGQSNRNMFLQKFLQDQLQQKAENTPSNNMNQTGMPSYMHLPLVEQQSHQIQAHIQAQHKQVQTLQAQHQLFEQARALFGMHMTQDQLAEFKKQFTVYQQQYVQLNQALLMSNTMTNFNISAPHDQFLYSLNKGRDTIGATQIKDQALRHRRYHSTNPDNSFVQAAKDLQNGMGTDQKQSSKIELLQRNKLIYNHIHPDKKLIVKAPKIITSHAEADFQNDPNNAHLKSFYQTGVPKLNQVNNGRAYGKSTRNKTKKMEQENSQSLTRPTGFNMTLGSGPSTTPPITAEQHYEQLMHQQSKTERKVYPYKNGEVTSDRKQKGSKQNAKFDQLRQSFEDPSIKTFNDDGEKTYKYKKEQHNSAFTANMARTMYTENPRIYDEFTTNDQPQPSNSVNTSNNNFDANLNVMNQNLVNPQPQVPKAYIVVNQNVDHQYPQRSFYRNNGQLAPQNQSLTMQNVNHGSKEHSKESYGNKPKLNHALRQRNDMVESQNKHYPNQKMQLVAGTLVRKQKNDGVLFSVNENTRGKLQDTNRIDFPEISSIKNDPRKNLTEQHRISSFSKDQNSSYGQQKLPTGTLNGQDVDLRNHNSFQHNMNGNIKYQNNIQQYSIKKQQQKVKHKNGGSGQNSFFLPSSEPLNNDQILTNEYLAKRGASQSSQGFKATNNTNQAISLHHGKPGAESSFGRAKYMTPGQGGQYNKFTPKTSNLAPTINTKNNIVPELKNKYVNSYDQYGIASPTSPGTISMNNDSPNIIAAKNLTAEKLNSRESIGRQKQKTGRINSDQVSKNSLIVIKDGKQKYMNAQNSVEQLERGDYKENR